MSCKNCGHDLEGNFCSNCGQSAKVDKISYGYVLSEIPNSLFQIDHGFFYTVKELFTRPGNSLREFMEGKRKDHYKPLAFLLITSTLYALFDYFSFNGTPQSFQLTLGDVEQEMESLKTHS